MNMVTIKDVARRAGVSTATVSRVLNEHPSIAQDARQRVNVAIEELGYRPNAIARSLRLTSTSTLGLVMGSIANPFFAELARAVEDEARANGYSVIIGNAEHPEQQDHYVSTLLEHRVDGLLLVPMSDESSTVNDAVARGERVVLIDRDMPGLDAPAVRVNSGPAIHELVQHLAALGHSRLGLIAGPQDTSTGRQQLADVQAAMREHGLNYREELVRRADYGEQGGSAAAAELLCEPEPPTAIFAVGNLVGLGALQEMRERGLVVPDDIGLAVYDELPWFALTDPPLTTIAQPTREMGHAAVDLLLARLRGQALQPPTLQARLVPRRSCGEGGGPAATDKVDARGNEVPEAPSRAGIGG